MKNKKNNKKQKIEKIKKINFDFEINILKNHKI